MHRKLLSWLSAVLMLLGVLTPAMSALGHHRPGSWSVTVSEPQYVGGNTIFTYTISATGEPHALSHFNLGYCAEWGAITTSPRYDEIGDDPPTGMTSVIKWERSVPYDQTLTITLTLTGLWATGNQQWLVKTGQGDYSDTLSQGASCSRVAPDFAISKKVGPTADGPWADELILEGGGMAYYRYVFTNTGNAPLTISQATDDKLGNISYPSAPVPVGGNVVLGPVSKAFPALPAGSPPQEEINTITVRATFGGTTYGPKSDTAKVINRPGPEPDFAITKQVSTEPTGPWSDTVTLVGGGTVHYRYSFTNTGTVPLTITSAVDDILGAVTFSSTAVGVGATVFATKSKTFPSLPPEANEQQETNTITVTAAYAGNPVDTKQAQATVHNLPSEARFTVTKMVSQVNDPATGTPSVTLANGGTVYYFYTVTNTGDVPLTITGATDDKLGAIAFSPARILPGETAAGTAQKSFGALPPGGSETEVNTITVSTRTDDNHPLGPQSAHATVVNLGEPPDPKFEVTKYVSTQNDPATGVKQVELQNGGTVYYFYTLTNTGNVPLTITAVTDNVISPISFGVSVLAPGQSVPITVPWTFPTLHSSSPPQEVLNTISVTMTDGAGFTETKTDSALVINYPPGAGNFAITKLVAATNDSGAAGPNLILNNGGTAYFFYTVTNTGEVDIRITSAVDDKLGPIAFNKDVLAPGETATGTASKSFAPLPPGSAPLTEVNEITVEAISFPGEEDLGERKAQATVTVNPPPTASLTVEKKVSTTNNRASGQDSITLNNGGNAYYFYTVTNTGQAPLTLTSALDDKLGAIAFSPTRLEPGQSATGTAQKSFGQLAPGVTETEINTITITALTDDNRTVGPESDQATVVNNGPAKVPDFTVTKFVGTTSDPASGSKLVELNGGGTVYYFYTVTNTGNVPLTITNVLDTVISPVSFPVLVLAPGESTSPPPIPWAFPALHHSNPPQQVENVIAVTVTDGNGYTETKSDNALVINNPPPPPGAASFTVTKQVGSTNNPAGAGPNLTLNNGGTAWFFYTFTNTGEVPLRITSAVDDKLGNVSFPSDWVAPGATVSLGTKSKTFPTLTPGGAPVTEVNVIAVTAVTQNQERIGPNTATATVVNFPPPPPYNPNFTVTKQVSTSNDPATGQPSVSIKGGTVWYFYTVTNTGDVTIQLTGAVDDKLGPISLSSHTLTPGQSATGVASKSFAALPHGSVTETEVNTITVTASYGATRQAQATVTNTPLPPPPALGSVEVRVLDGSPRLGGVTVPISGAHISFTGGKTGITNDSGSILFTGLTFGAYEALGTAANPLNGLEPKSGNGSVTITEGAPHGVITIILQWVAPPPPNPSLTVLVCPTFVANGGTITAENGSGQQVRLQWNGTGFHTDALSAGEWSVILSAPAWDRPHVRTISIRDDLSVPGNVYELDLFHPCPPKTGSGSGFVCSPKAQSVLTATGPDGAEVSLTISPSGKSEWIPFNLGDLVPGLWQVAFKEPGKKDATASGQVQAGKATDFGYLHLACTGSPAPVTGYVAGLILFAAGLGLQLRLRFRKG